MYEKIHNLYIHILLKKKNYINLFIIITMNKKKATVPTKLKTDYADIAATGTCHR